MTNVFASGLNNQFNATCQINVDKSGQTTFSFVTAAGKMKLYTRYCMCFRHSICCFSTT